MTIIDRKTKHREAVRESILEAAFNIVYEEGWQALSIRKIANAIEYSAPVIYDHFENKEAILNAFALQGFEKLNGMIATAIDHQEEPEQQIAAIGRAYWHFSLENRELYQIMYGLGMPTCDEVQASPEMTRFSKMIIEPIERLSLKRGGDVSKAMTKFKTYWSLLHGLVSIHILQHSKKQAASEQVLLDFTELFIAGI